MRLLLCGAFVAILGCVAALSALADYSKAKNPNVGKLRHVVMFKFKDGTTPEQIKEIEDAFRALPSKISEIVGFEWGTNNSPENMAQGFTHCFFLTFNDAASRAVYLPHPAHKEFGKLLRPHLDKVLVVDYVVQTDSLPQREPATDWHGPAGRDPSIAWNLANGFMAREFANKYVKMGQAVSPVSGSPGTYDVRFPSLDTDKKEGVVRVDINKRTCSWLGERPIAR